MLLEWEWSKGTWSCVFVRIFCPCFCVKSSQAFKAPGQSFSHTIKMRWWTIAASFLPNLHSILSCPVCILFCSCFVKHTSNDTFVQSSLSWKRKAQRRPPTPHTMDGHAFWIVPFPRANRNFQRSVTVWLVGRTDFLATFVHRNASNVRFRAELVPCDVHSFFSKYVVPFNVTFWPMGVLHCMSRPVGALLVQTFHLVCCASTIYFCDCFCRCCCCCCRVIEQLQSGNDKDDDWRDDGE